MALTTKKEEKALLVAIKKELRYLKQLREKRAKRGADITDLDEQIAFIEVSLL